MPRGTARAEACSPTVRVTSRLRDPLARLRRGLTAAPNAVSDEGDEGGISTIREPARRCPCTWGAWAWSWL